VQHNHIKYIIAEAVHGIPGVSVKVEEKESRWNEKGRLKTQAADITFTFESAGYVFDLAKHFPGIMM
jgi:hypothetical protein